MLATRPLPQLRSFPGSKRPIVTLHHWRVDNSSGESSLPHYLFCESPSARQSHFVTSMATSGHGLTHQDHMDEKRKVEKEFLSHPEDEEACCYGQCTKRTCCGCLPCGKTRNSYDSFVCLLFTCFTVSLLLGESQTEPCFPFEYTMNIALLALVLCFLLCILTTITFVSLFL